MYNIEVKKINNTKNLIFHGGINSINVEEVSNLVFSLASAGESVIFDFEHLDFISSAGLRLVLKSGKAFSNFEVINVSSDVYSTFEMTGFTEILKISKALRVVSIEGKELIGEGYMGRVYRLDPETIIKVYYRNSTIEDIKREISLAKTAFVLGIPTAIPFDVVKVKEGFYGSVFELLTSSSFNKYFIKHPENVDKYITMYIDLLKQIMSIRITKETDIPRKKDEALLWWNSLNEQKAFDQNVLDKMKRLIDNLPENNHLIHGDFHIKNIMMQGDEPLLIDMDTLGIGHEIFEFAAFYLTYIGYPSTAPGNVEQFLGIPQKVADRLFYETVDEIFKDKDKLERNKIIDKIALLLYFWLTYKTLIFEPDNLDF